MDVKPYVGGQSPVGKVAAISELATGIVDVGVNYPVAERVLWLSPERQRDLPRGYTSLRRSRTWHGNPCRIMLKLAFVAFDYDDFKAMDEKASWYPEGHRLAKNWALLRPLAEARRLATAPRHS